MCELLPVLVDAFLSADLIPSPTIGGERLPPIVKRLAVRAPSRAASRAPAHQRDVHQPRARWLDQRHVVGDQHRHIRQSRAVRPKGRCREQQLGHHNRQRRGIMIVCRVCPLVRVKKDRNYAIYAVPIMKAFIGLAMRAASIRSGAISPTALAALGKSSEPNWAQPLSAPCHDPYAGHGMASASPRA